MGMITGALFSIGLVTAGAGILGLSVSRQLRGARSGRQVAEDWLCGLGIMLVGAARGIRGDLGLNLSMLGLALLVGGTVVTRIGAGRDRRQR
jgi:hypothetical protein